MLIRLDNDQAPKSERYLIATRAEKESWFETMMASISIPASPFLEFTSINFAHGAVLYTRFVTVVMSSSSLSSTRSHLAPASLPKSHACQIEGCGKKFTRAEHLRRHALNHEVDDNSCDRCSVHFSRPDLLGKYHSAVDTKFGKTPPGRS